MNSSSYDSNVSSSLYYRDSTSAAVTKNVIVVALGLIINYINAAMIHTFRKHQVFYLNPRYILFIHLVVNDMVQLTTTITLFVLNYLFYQINVSICCLILIFAILTTFNTPLNVAAMAVECYVAVCFPLQHTEVCTIKRTYALIGWIWTINAVSTLFDVFVILATEHVSFFHSTIRCNNENLFQHPISLKKRDVSHMICLISVWITIFFTYFRIFFVAKAAKATKSTAGKATTARNTILLHSFQLLLCMLTYVYHLILRGLLSLFPKYFQHIMFVSYIFLQILPRLISPMVYGLRDKTFKQYLRKYLLFTMRAEVKP